MSVDIRTGVINYSTFDRNIESVFINDDTAVVMGSETIKTIGQGSDSGETIHRRYTNVWMNIDGKWLLTARHANVICGQ